MRSHKPNDTPGGPERALNAVSLTALGLGGLIGAGIFATVGIAAHDKAGPAVVLSFLVAAVACIAVALCYCECASTVPVAGSAYAYAHAAIGRAGAWLTGWNLATCYFLAGAAVSQAWSGYFQSLLGPLGVAWPRIVSGAPFDLNPASGGFAPTGSLLNLPSLLVLAAVTVVVYRGIRLSLRFNNAILVLKLAVLAVVIVAGLAHANPANWTPFAPFGYGGLGLRNLLSGFGGKAAAASTGMLAGATTVFFAFGGFEMLSAYSHECRAPRRDVPVAVIATITLLTLLYIAVAAAVVGLVPYHQINVEAPVSEAFKSAGMPWAQMLVAFGAVAGMTSVLLVLVMSLPRVLMAVGADGLLSGRFFNAIHPRFHTPSKGVLAVGVVAMLVGSLLPLRFLMDAVMMATLAGYVAVCAFALLLRRRPAPSEPVFRAPLGPVIPLFGIAVCLLLMLSLPPVNWLRLASWWALGMAVYAAYGRRSAAGSYAAVAGARERERARRRSPSPPYPPETHRLNQGERDVPHITLPEGFPGISGPMAAYPASRVPLNDLANAVMAGPSSLTKGERELIATFVSSRNECRFCTKSHAAAARRLLPDANVVDALLAREGEPEIGEKMRALLEIAGKVRRDGRLVTAEDVRRAREAGADDQAIHDTVLITGMFCMFNRYVDGLATLEPADPVVYDQIGERIATRGYGTIRYPD